MRAVDKGNIDIVKTLIAANADLNMQNAVDYMLCDKYLYNFY